MVNKLLVNPATGRLDLTVNTAAIEARIVALEETDVRITWFESIGAGTNGTITPPTGATIQLNEWAAGVDALLSQIDTGRPNNKSPVDASGNIVTTTLDVNGNYTFSGTPSAYPVALIYVYTSQIQNFDDTKALYESELVPGGLHQRTFATVTIAAGVAALSGPGRYPIDTQGGASSDALDQCAGLVKGDVVTLFAADDARTVVVTKGASMKMPGDFSLENQYDRIVMECIGSNVLVELSRSNNS